MVHHTAWLLGSSQEKLRARVRVVSDNERHALSVPLDLRMRLGDLRRPVAHAHFLSLLLCTHFLSLLCTHFLSLLLGFIFVILCRLRLLDSQIPRCFGLFFHGLGWCDCNRCHLAHRRDARVAMPVLSYATRAMHGSIPLRLLCLLHRELIENIVWVWLVPLTVLIVPTNFLSSSSVVPHPVLIVPPTVSSSTSLRYLLLFVALRAASGCLPSRFSSVDCSLLQVDRRSIHVDFHNFTWAVRNKYGFLFIGFALGWRCCCSCSCSYRCCALLLFCTLYLFDAALCLSLSPVPVVPAFTLQLRRPGGEHVLRLVHHAFTTRHSCGVVRFSTTAAAFLSPRTDAYYRRPHSHHAVSCFSSVSPRGPCIMGQVSAISAGRMLTFRPAAASSST